MENSREFNIALFAGDGDLERLKQLLEPSFNQTEIDVALENAIAYSQIHVADFLLSIGAQISYGDFQGVYYAVHNNEIEGLKYAITKGIDININNGMLLNTSIETATNTNDIEITKWLLNNGANIHFLSNHANFLINKYGSVDLKNLINSFNKK